MVDSRFVAYGIIHSTDGVGEPQSVCRLSVWNTAGCVIYLNTMEKCHHQPTSNNTCLCSSDKSLLWLRGIMSFVGDR